MMIDSIKPTNGNVPITSPVYKNKLLRFLAWVVSCIFHPLFIPLYVTYYIAFIHPRYFSGFNTAQRLLKVISVGINMVVYPIIAVLLLKAVGFIDSILLKTQKDRVIPYIACGIFFFWMYLVFRNQPEVPSVLTTFTFAVFLSSSVALIANIYYKISMHAIGCGGLIGFMFVLLYSDTSSQVAIPLMISILIFGVVCTSRLLLGDHTQKEIYLGLFLGICCQVSAAAMLL